MEKLVRLCIKIGRTVGGKPFKHNILWGDVVRGLRALRVMLTLVAGPQSAMRCGTLKAGRPQTQGRC